MGVLAIVFLVLLHVLLARDAIIFSRILFELQEIKAV